MRKENYQKAYNILRGINFVYLPISIILALFSFFMLEGVAYYSHQHVERHQFDLVILSLIPFVWLFYPVILVISIFLSGKFYKKENYSRAFWISLIPTIPIIPIFALLISYFWRVFILYLK